MRDISLASLPTKLTDVLVAVLRCVVLVAMLRHVMLIDFVVRHMSLMMMLIGVMRMINGLVIRTCDASTKHHCDGGSSHGQARLHLVGS